MSDNTLDALEAAKETMRNASRTLGKIDAREQAQKQIEDESPEGLVQKVKDVAIAARRINKVWDAAQALYEKVSPWAGPVLRPVWRGAVGVKGAFVWAAYERENGELKRDADGDPIFSIGRLGRVFATAAMIGVSGVAGVQAAYFYGTHFSEYTFVTGKEMITPGEKYEFSGASSLPFSTQLDNGKYYQIEQSLYWPRLMYPEEDVFAMIPQNGVCKVEGFGFYMKELKWLHKATESYQNVFNASCFPLTEKQTDSIIMNKSTPEQVFKGMTP